MLSFLNKKETKQKIKNLTDIRVIGLILFSFVVLLVAWSSVRVLELNYKLQKQEVAQRQKNDIQRLENENQKLKNAYFESDEYLELTARRQFNKAARGETLYLVPKEVAYSKTIVVEKPQTADQIKQQKKQSKSKYRQNIEDWVEFLFRKGSPTS